VVSHAEADSAADRRKRAGVTGKTLTFAPSRSRGQLSLILLALGVTSPQLFLVLSVPRLPVSAITVLLGTAVVVAAPLLVLAAFFPAMRYELDDDELRLIYGPLLRYRIALRDVVGVHRQDLSVAVWSSVRLPGIALFRVPYNDIGIVRMCATRAAERVLLVRTHDGQYGLTPADEPAFLGALMERLPA
jgi:PH (Pleckstrin Homology) domain-containing protein